MVADVEQIRQMIASGTPLAQIAKTTGVHAFTVARIHADILRAQAKIEHRLANPIRGWSTDEDDRLRDMFKQGFSASQMSMALDNRSRNSVIGRLHRLGLRSGDHASRPRINRQKTPRQREDRKKLSKVIWNSVQTLRKEALGRLLVSEPLPPAVEPDIPLQKRLTIEKLEEHHCRWPYGDSGHFHFCGKRKIDGLPYCEEHARRSYAAPKPQRMAPRPEPAPKPEKIPTFDDAVREDLKV